MSKTFTSEQKLEHFLTELALKKNVAAATQNQAFNAVLFFYKDVLGMTLCDCLECSESPVKNSGNGKHRTFNIQHSIPNIQGARIQLWMLNVER